MRLWGTWIHGFALKLWIIIVEQRKGWMQLYSTIMTEIPRPNRLEKSHRSIKQESAPSLSPRCNIAISHKNFDARLCHCHLAPETQIRARKASGVAEISEIQDRVFCSGQFWKSTPLCSSSGAVTCANIPPFANPLRALFRDYGPIYGSIFVLDTVNGKRDHLLVKLKKEILRCAS